MTLCIRAAVLFAICSVFLVAAAGTGLADGKPGKLSGTIEFHELQVAYIGSGTMGHGTLTFQGKTYPIEVGGLGIGGIGVSKIEAHGKVYDLEELDKFEGLYGQARYGLTVGDKSTGQMWLENQNGVYIHLDTKREGLMLSTGADGLSIHFAK